MNSHPQAANAAPFHAGAALAIAGNHAIRAGMAPHDIPALLAFADELADAARAAILPFFRAAHGLENKAAGGFDPVTEADRAAERAMRALIEARFPGHGISGEEFGDAPSRDGYLWALDPIDGTRAFISGLPLWGVLIGLSFEGAPLIGVMDQPYLGERFRGWPGGADLVTPSSARALRTRDCAALAEATLSTTDPYLFRDGESDLFARARAATRLQRYGCDCYAYCMVAAGAIDLVIESGLKMHDVAALIPIIEGAGGAMTTWDGASALNGGRILASGDARVHAEAMALLRAG